MPRNYFQEQIHVKVLHVNIKASVSANQIKRLSVSVDHITMENIAKMLVCFIHLFFFRS